MNKSEAEELFDEKGEEALVKLLDYILIEKDYDKAATFVMDITGCDKTVAQAIVLETIPQSTHSDLMPSKGEVTCPYCHSKNTKKISGLSKAGSVALWGVFAVGKVSKQWHCNNCKSDF